MKIRGNESGAETSFLASYYLITLPITQVIALNLKKISAETKRFLTYASPFIVIIHFTTDN